MSERGDEASRLTESAQKLLVGMTRRGARWPSARDRRTRHPPRRRPGWDRRPPGGRTRCASSAPNRRASRSSSSVSRIEWARPPGRAARFLASSSGGGTIRKQVRTVSASALLVACHTASRPASSTHSSSSHSPMAPSGEPRARTQDRRRSPRRPAAAAVGDRRGDQVAGQGVRHGPHQRAQDLVARFVVLLRRPCSSVSRLEQVAPP